MRWGILLRWGSFWVGAHWSGYNRRLCINLVPFITLWVTLKGGTAPSRYSITTGIGLAEAFEVASTALTPETLKALDQLITRAIENGLSLEEFKFLADEILKEAP